MLCKQRREIDIRREITIQSKVNQKVLGDTENRQTSISETISVGLIDELSPINFSDKCCVKFSMCFLYVKLQKRFSRFFKKIDQSTDLAVAFLSKIFFKL